MEAPGRRCLHPGGAGPEPPPRSRRCSAGRAGSGRERGSAPGRAWAPGAAPGAAGRADAGLGAAPAVPRGGPGLAPARRAALPGQARRGHGPGRSRRGSGSVPPGPVVLLHPAELGAGLRAPHRHDRPPSGMVPSEQAQRRGLFPHGLQRYHPLPAAQADRAIPAGAAPLRALRQHHHAGDGRQHPPGRGLGEPPARLQRLPAAPGRAGEPRHQGAAPRDTDRLLRAALLLRRVPGALHVVHPVLPDPLHLLHRLLHARGGAERDRDRERDRERDRDAPGRPAPAGTQQPLLLVPGDRGPDLPPLPLHLLRHDGAGAAPAAQGAGAGQQRPLPAALLPHRPPPHRRLGGLALERSHAPEKISRGDLRPRALGLLQPAPERPALRGGGEGREKGENRREHGSCGFCNRGRCVGNKFPSGGGGVVIPKGTGRGWSGLVWFVLRESEFGVKRPRNPTGGGEFQKIRQAGEEFQKIHQVGEEFQKIRQAGEEFQKIRQVGEEFQKIRQAGENSRKSVRGRTAAVSVPHHIHKDDRFPTNRPKPRRAGGGAPSGPGIIAFPGIGRLSSVAMAAGFYYSSAALCPEPPAGEAAAPPLLPGPETARIRPKTMAKFLSQDQINEFKECFSLYDKRRKGKIQGSELLAVMRSLGVSPTPGEVQRHLQLHGIDRNAELDFSTFLTIMYRQMKQEEPEREILRALAMMDRHGRGVIAAAELRAKLTRLGEKLSEEEVDDLLKEAGVGPNGTIKYEEFVRNICLPAVDY